MLSWATPHMAMPHDSGTTPNHDPRKAVRVRAARSRQIKNTEMSGINTPWLYSGCMFQTSNRPASTL